MNVREFQVSGETGISVRDFGGEGAAILLLHGAGRNLEDLTRIAENLVRDHRVAAMDFRAHGRSEDGPWNAPAVLDDVTRVIDALGFVKPSLAGHSLGGMISALYAVERGGVSAVVNWDGYGNGRPEHYIGMDPDAVSEFQRTLDDLGDGPWPGDEPVDAAVVQEYLASTLQFGEATGVSPADLLLAAVRHLSAAPEGGTTIQPARRRLLEMSQVLSGPDWLDVFARVRVPFLLYRCESTDGLPAEWAPFVEAYGRGLRTRITEIGARHTNIMPRILRDEGHSFILTMPDALADELRELVAKVDER